MSGGDGEITGHDDTHALSTSFRKTLSGPKALCNRLREVAKTVRWAVSPDRSSKIEGS